MNAGDYTVWLPTLMLAALRLAGMVMVAPVFAAAAVPIKLRAATALVMSLAVVARMTGPAQVPTADAELLLACCAELLIGAGIGYAARLIFAGVQLGAFHIAQQMGLALGEVFNPLAAETAGIIRSLLAILSVAIFVLIGGHRALVSGLLRTFQAVPLASGAPGQSLLAVAVNMLAGSFVLALKVAGPVLITMLLATVAMGLLQKALPQCNLLSTHLPIRALLGLAALAVLIAAVEPPLAAAVELLTDQISSLT